MPPEAGERLSSPGLRITRMDVEGTISMNEAKDVEKPDSEQTPCATICYPPVLDACCGSRMMWFDRSDDRAVFVDKRCETHVIDKGTPGTKGRSPIVVDPDWLADFTDLPFPDDTFALVVFDPPHIQREKAKGILTKKYGHLTGDWREMIRDGFAECFRVLRPDGVLVFKWAESEVRVSEILKLTPMRPLFGHKSGKLGHTHWMTFMKPPCGG